MLTLRRTYLVALAVLVAVAGTAFASDRASSAVGEGGIDSMMGGGMVGTLFMSLFWLLIVASLIAPVVWVISEIQGR